MQVAVTAAGGTVKKSSNGAHIGIANDIEINENGIRIIGKELNGAEIDLNETPDLLPVMAVVACFAKDETRLVKNILNQFKSVGVFPQVRDLTLPKLTLFLTETEYDLLGIRFEVNDVYDLIMKDGAFMLKKSTEGV